MRRLIVPLMALAACQPTQEAPTPLPTTSPAPSTSSTAPATTSTSTTTSTTTTVTTVMQAEPAPVVSPQRAADGPGLGSDLLACIRSYEQGEDGYRTDTGNGYYGAYQFDLQTWRSVGGSGNPAHASPAEQDARALALHESRGLAPWPTPSRLCA